MRLPETLTAYWQAERRRGAHPSPLWIAHDSSGNPLAWAPHIEACSILAARCNVPHTISRAVPVVRASLGPTGGLMLRDPIGGALFGPYRSFSAAAAFARDLAGKHAVIEPQTFY